MRKYNRVIALLLCVTLAAASLTACGKKNKEEVSKTEEKVEKEGKRADTADTPNESGEEVAEVKFMERPSLGKEINNDLYDPNLVPSVPAYSTDVNLSNIINAEYSENWDSEYKQKLAENLFVVEGESGLEFFEVYEMNAYSQSPNFVTVDSLMHTYHIYFAHLLKNTEKTYLSDELKKLSLKMFEEAVSQHDALEGSEWEDAASRNVAYFAVACNLIGESVNVPDYAKSMAETELSKVMAESDIEESVITGLKEDYTQYKPRGYYEENPQLEQYFRTMMWYGRMTFAAQEADMTRSAILISLALNKAGTEEWNKIYGVTSFFAGASDDYGYCEYMPIIEAVYGKDGDISRLADNKDGIDGMLTMLKKMNPPRVQSIPVYDDEENVIPGFRFMGQRFTIDVNIMQNLVYRAVNYNENGEARMLPDVLDVPAALGSKVAEEIVLNEGAAKFPDYIKNLDKLRNDISNSSDEMWNASLYAGWLNTLRPLLDEKGDGYPSFMTNKEWTKKTLETFAGSYSELKHDTVLYSKQPMAEMGGGDLDEVDDRGYVEPEPLVYARFANLAKTTADGLQEYGMINSEDKNSLELLTELANKLLVISQKELKNELPTNEEFELIKNYGGNIEHFWFEAMKSEAEGDEYYGITSEEYPAALVVDVATDPNGSVLEAGTGNPREIAVVVPVDGILRIAYGSAYNFYEFEWPMSDRLTDSKWRQMIGAEPGEGWVYERDPSMDNPEWTKSYRSEKYNYDWW